MKRLFAVIALCLSATQCGMIPAAAREPDDAFKQRVVELSEFVRVATGYRSKAEPYVVFLPADTINRVYFAEKYKEGERDIIAVTIGNVIMLRTDFQLGADDHILVHELVHFMQFDAGEDQKVGGNALCLEPEAYHVQDVWRAAHGAPERADPLRMIAFRMACQGGG